MSDTKTIVVDGQATNGQVAIGQTTNGPAPADRQTLQLSSIALPSMPWTQAHASGGTAQEQHQSALNTRQSTDIDDQTAGDHVLPGRWSDSCWDCLDDVASCLCSMFCSACRNATTLSRSKVARYWRVLCFYGLVLLSFHVLVIVILWGQVDVSTSRICQFLLYAFAASFLLARVIFRQWLRARYQLPDTCCTLMGDVAGHMFCPICMTSQEARHVDRSSGYIGRPAHTTLSTIGTCTGCCDRTNINECCPCCCRPPPYDPLSSV